MKKALEIIISFSILLIVGAFVVFSLIGRSKEPARKMHVAYHEDGSVRASSDLFVIGDAAHTTRPAERVSEKSPQSLGERIFATFGVGEDEVLKTREIVIEDSAQETTVAHIAQADAPDGYDFDAYMDEVDAQNKKIKKEKERKEEDEKDDDDDDTQDVVEENDERVIVEIGASEFVRPYYPREDDDESNRVAREILIQNVVRDSSFGLVFTAPDNPDNVLMTITADDAHQRRMLEEMKAVQLWAGENRIIVSEVGITSDDDDDKYIALANKFFEAANPMGLSTMGWAIGDWWGGYAGSLSSSSQISAEGVSGPFVANSLTTNRYVRGLNLAGGEFGMDPDANGEAGSINDRYTYHKDSGLWGAMKQRGFTYARFPFRLERLFHEDGSINATDRAYLEEAIVSARAQGMKILLDPHNYGAMKLDGTKAVTGGSVFTAELYNTMMRGMAQIALANADVVDMVSLMNEPKNVDPTEWEGLAQGAVDAIRAEGYTGVIEVPTGNWQGIQDVPRIHPDGPWITDPGNNFMYGVHQYFDENHSGHHQRTYAEDEAILSNYYAPGPVEVWGVQ